MGRRVRWLKWLRGSADEERASVAELLRHRYVREKQHAMRYSQHAERMRYPQFRDTLAAMASEEESHAGLIAEKIKALGDQVPDVIPIHVAKEANAWHYLRTDLEEEDRCAGELHRDLARLRANFPDVAELLEGVETDGERHRVRLRDMISRSDPQAAGLP